MLGMSYFLSIFPNENENIQNAKIAMNKHKTHIGR